jgi:hypothetical protein
MKAHSEGEEARPQGDEQDNADRQRTSAPGARGQERAQRALRRRGLSGGLTVEAKRLLGRSIEKLAIGADESLDEDRRREFAECIRLEGFQMAPADPCRARDVVERHALRFTKPAHMQSQRAHDTSRGVYALGSGKVKARG